MAEQLSLFEEPEKPIWGNKHEIERRNRIKLSIAAYAYEILNEPIISDDEFDQLAEQIRPKMSTGHGRIDAFFRNHFDPFTGIWIHSHPDLEGVKRTYERHYAGTSP